MQCERGGLRAHFEFGEAFAELVGEGAQGGVFEDQLFHGFSVGGGTLVASSSACGSSSSNHRGNRLRGFAGVDEFVVAEVVVVVGKWVVEMEFGEIGLLLGAGEDVGVGDCAAGCGDDVEGFSGYAESAAAAAAAVGAVFFAEGAESCAGEDLVVVGFSGVRVV